MTPGGSHTSQPLLEAISVSRRFGSFQAVDSVSIQVNAGEVVGLLGANGAGKTTVLRMALGLIAPTSGDVRLLGRTPDRQVRRRMGYVPQGLGLYADMSVRENLQFVAAVYGQPAPGVPAELQASSEALVGSIPLGEQRILAFACALLHDPVLLVLDEPTSGVGALTRVQLWDTIQQRAKQGVGVLVTTHYMQEAQQCDRLLLMSGGRLVGSGSEADLVAGTTAVEVDCADWAAAFAALQSAGQPVTLTGRSVRVANADPAALSEILAAAQVSAQLRSVPATIEERMVVLAASQ